MEFQDYAEAEVSAVIAQLIADQTGPTLQALNAARESLEAAARALTSPPNADLHIGDLVGKLSQAAEADVRCVRDELGAAIDRARAELRAQVAENDRLAAAIALAEAEAALLKSELQTTQERAAAAESDLTATLDAHAQIEASLRRLESDWTRAAQSRAQLQAELSQACGTIDDLHKETEQLRGKIERLTSDNVEISTLLTTVREDAQAQRTGLIVQLETAAGRIDALQADLARAQAAARDREALAGQLEATGARMQALEADLARAQAASNDREVLAVQLHTANVRVHELEADLARARTTSRDRDAFSAELDAAAARIHALETDLARARDAARERDLLASELETASTRVRALEADLTQVNDASDARDVLAAELAASRDRLLLLEDAQAKHEDQVRQLTTRLDEALQSEARLQEKLATRTSEPAGSGTDVEIMRAEVDRMVSLLDASARAVAEMAATTTSTGLLTELLKRLSLQFSRVALFRVKGNRLEGEQQVGFDEATNITKLAFPTSMESILSRAMHSKTLETVSGDDVAERTGMPFGGTPTSAVAIPIVLQGAAIAVVYGDDADMPDWARGPAVHESSVGFARLLVGQVVVLLMRHTHELKTIAELRQYASTLVQEAREMYQADAQDGKAADLLRSRLKANLECASQLYAYRAAMEGTAAAGLFDEQLALELQESTPFARDLAVVVDQMSGNDLRVTAEAS
jgi:predicted  nucleic acid-binding Zn-ribbon protein